MSQQNREILGLQEVRNGVKYLLISEIFGIIFEIIVIATLFAINNLDIGLSVGIFGLVIQILLLYLTYVNIKSGFQILTSLGRDLGRGITSIILIVAGTAITIIAFIFLLPVLFSAQALNPSVAVGTILSSAVGAVAFALIGGVLGLVGYILLFLAFMKTGEIYNNKDIKDGGLIALIGFILSIIISIIGLIITIIGFYKIYSGLGNIIGNLPSQQQQLPTMFQPSLPIEQVGVGKLYSNGIAEATIYSQFQLGILTATILGTSYSTSNIVPNQLSVGYNNIKIDFKASFTFIAGNIYVVQLMLSNGQTLNISVTYQP
ncbi:DUF973 family protein [Saccharolobus solfataricus]|uniref:DUF973 family protein n=3 Tax=Saccharolobus solfataricus TaxID=2287 RepID=Q7LX78_SACS2|nr:DUF973 family protein [Saccharolobus solfataricus]AAK42297.1 Hypothetical protein SSO2118 [Saccharolobus solfataricus P2]AKA74911.1 DUF973 family protein [Saccharolobus solfataricus]AKA77607.1 DUF973 family protein [Saccharolobus solfataricus]AKA80298.1 DUF973 family protein [Saccharolobus solfataricus]AZF69377.1 DUF973 family protein [Saccharolobus solfataricus]